MCWVMSFTCAHKIRFDDVDGAGIVYYPQYFHLCHEAFEDFFEAAAPFSYPQMILKRRLGFPAVALESTFTAPLSYGDVAVTELWVERIGNTSVKFGYRIRRKEDDTLCFEARVTAVLMNLDSRRPVPLEDDFRRLFSGILRQGE